MRFSRLPKSIRKDILRAYIIITFILRLSRVREIFSLCMPFRYNIFSEMENKKRQGHMKSKVYFLPLDRLGEFDKAVSGTGIFDPFEKGDRVALKLHFGSMGHDNTVPAGYISGIISVLLQKGCFPFLTDTNVLYRDDRDATLTHLEVASKNGYDRLGAPIVIAGGDNSDDSVSIKGKSKYYDEFHIAREYTEVEGMIALTHFKGHGLACIGGTIKNLGMGCASRKGKFAMHANITPDIKKKKCIGCGLCVKKCPAHAISLVKETASIDQAKCIGCAQCVHTCPHGVIGIPWFSVTPQEFQEKIAEYANCARNLFGKKFFAVNFLVNITSLCDCETNPGKKIAPDMGVLFSCDPVAIDRACVDMVTAAQGPDIPAGEEKFSRTRPGSHPHFQLDHAEKTGLGRNDYEIINL